MLDNHETEGTMRLDIESKAALKSLICTLIIVAFTATIAFVIVSLMPDDMAQAVGDFLRSIFADRRPSGW